MNCMHNADNVIRSHRKYLLNAGSLFLILSLLITQIACRPSDDEGDSNAALDGVDNVEFHHVKIVDGVMHEDHPVIMYKEDFVNEHNKPYGRHSGKKYKDIAGHRQRDHQNKTVAAEENQSEKSEKIYFDVLPTVPVVNDDDEKFDMSQIKVEHLPLELKDSKRPKKYHHRVRRQADTEEHHVHKRNPYYRHVYYYRTNYVAPIQPQPQQTKITVFQRHPVQGQRQPSTVSFGSRLDGPIRFPTDDENENVDKEVFPPAPAPVSTRRPSIWHDSNPDNADFSVFDKLTTSAPGNSIQQATRPPNNRFTTSRPPPNRFTTQRPTQRPAPTTTTPAPAPAERPVSGSAGVPSCVWAIINCCNNGRRIRYSCFENYGCLGSFWDLNPCSAPIVERAYSFVADLYDDE